MKRRELLQGVMAAAGSRGFMSHVSAQDAVATDGFDRFGGWKGKKFEATGFFRVEKDERWWLVTPEGNAFLSFGINHLHQDLWKQDYNREAWKKRLGLKDLNGRGFTPTLRTWFLETCRQYSFNTVGVHASLSVVNTPQPAVPYAADSFC